MPGFHRRDKAKTSLQDDDVPIDDTTTKFQEFDRNLGRSSQIAQLFSSFLPSNPVAFYFQTQSRVLIIPNCMLKLPLKRLRFNQSSPFKSNNKKPRNDIVTERLSRQDKEMELNQDPIGIKSDGPTETMERRQEVRESEPTGERQEVTGRETTAPLADAVNQLSTLLTRVKISDGAESAIPPFDGAYSATQFFQTFDRKMEDASMGEQEKLLRLSNYLVRQPLELFRKLRLADRSYFQVRQILLDLYPESSEASFAKYFAMKLTGQANLETYYREKNRHGIATRTSTRGDPRDTDRRTAIQRPAPSPRMHRQRDPEKINHPQCRVRTTAHPDAQVNGMHLFRRPIASSAARDTGTANADVDQSRRPTKKCGRCKQSQNNQPRFHNNQVKPGTPQPSSPFETEDKFNVPCLRIPPVKIPTNSEKIITIRPYRVPICDQQEIRNQIQQMLENGIIEQSFSPFSSPVTLVTKRDKTKRFCIDYRKVNELISSDVHPLPRIEDILDRLAQAKYFSTADISSAYWQVPIHPDSRPLLAFATFEGLYQPTRLPFGLKTSPQIYERAISQVLQRHGLDCVAHYFDDFIIYSNTLEEHQNHLRQFFAFCEAEKLQLNFAKCEFFKQSINFLGYTITAGTITPLTRNTDIIHAIKQPHNRKTLQSFLGAVNVYNKFIPEYARLRAPLNNLLKKDVVWNWNEACQEAFIDLKGNLTQHPILHLYKEVGPTYGELSQPPESKEPFDLLSLDTIAGFAKYGNTKIYLHVVVDHFSRYAWAFPSKSTSTTTYQQVLKRVFQDGSPKRLLTDRAPAFTSPKFRSFLLNRNIHPLLTTSNNPQANGLCERLNATLTGKLRLLHLENPKVAWTNVTSVLYVLIYEGFRVTVGYATGVFRHPDGSGSTRLTHGIYGDVGLSIRMSEGCEEVGGVFITMITMDRNQIKKTPAKFIPRFLTNEQKLCRLATCEDMLEMTRTDPEWKDKIITGYETWVYGYDPETKHQSAEWRCQGKQTPTARTSS
ncbi:hypothetical protein LAZ67_1006164 [Cordylochernes scorpioides]|uniref:Uncharacterized protein n=1 Tax=Cordylochernes scorpioides TaxID=51811 RepID=A0ABY6K1G9_9ARAC|nr:hypothetical protein LAZ67_1006164 [Cordylochernes scorpioides]